MSKVVSETIYNLLIRSITIYKKHSNIRMLLGILIGLFCDAAIKKGKKFIQSISRGHLNDVIIL